MPTNFFFREETKLYIDILFLLLDSALSRWEGDYDIIDNSSVNYIEIFNKKRLSSRKLASVVKTNKRGLSIMLKEDQQAAQMSHAKDDVVEYRDALGLTSFAIPLKFERQPIATIILGRFLRKDKDDRNQLYKQIRKLESELSLEGQLLSFVEKIPELTDYPVDLTLEKLHTVSNYVVEVARIQDSERLLQSARMEHERSLLRGQKLAKINFIAQEATNHLNLPELSWDEYWNYASKLLADLAIVLHANFGIIAVSRNKVISEYAITGTALIPKDIFAPFYTIDEKVRTNSGTYLESMVFDVVQSSDGFVKQLLNVAKKSNHNINFVNQVRFRIEPFPAGLIYLCFDHDAMTQIDFSENEMTGALEQFASILRASTFHRFLSDEHVKQQKLNMAWLEKITHQLLSPLSGLEGHVEWLLTRFEKWEETKPLMFGAWTPDQLDWFKNKLRSILTTSRQLRFLADNLAWWRGHLTSHINEFSPQIMYDVGGLLIDIARTYQGLAQDGGKAIQIVVNTNYMNAINGKLSVDETLFRQVLNNMLDNAVKYSISNTVIDIFAQKVDKKAEISVTNESAIRLTEEELIKVFDYGYRSIEAQNYHAPGTGIGLAVAREIVELHGGNIAVNPSQKSNLGWKTQFTISFPLL